MAPVSFLAILRSVSLNLNSAPARIQDVLTQTPAIIFGTLVTITGSSAFAQGPPDGYYDSVDTSNATVLRSTLHDVIDDHTRIQYSGSPPDAWTVLELAQRDPADNNRILDIYRNDSYPISSGGNGNYQREHSWPKSYGFPDDHPGNYPYSDCHLLFLCASSYNQARSNKPFRIANSGGTEYKTVANNGQGGQGGGYPGDSNWTKGQFTSGTWEVWKGRRGDIARAMFYADIRYEGGKHGSTGYSEPNLMLTDSSSLISGSNTGQNESVAYMGMLSVLLQWHYEDPVDAFEQWNNDMVFLFQGNRNPFADHPEWIDCLYNNNCGLGSNYCSPAVDNSTGLPASIFADGSATVSDADFRLVAVQMPTNQFGYFLTSQTQDFIFAPGGAQGNLCLGGNIGRFNNQVQSTGIFGTFGITVDLTQMPISPPAGVQPGETWNFTTWYRDKNPTNTSNFTDGYSVTFN